MARRSSARLPTELLLELRRLLRLTRLLCSSLRIVVKDTLLLKATLATGTTSTRGTLGEFLGVGISCHWPMLTVFSNDLVKAVAAVNKNVIVVGECRFEYHFNYRSSLLTACLALNSSQCRTHHPRINPVERQRPSNRMGWVSLTKFRINVNITDKRQSPRPRVRQRPSRHPLRLDFSRRQTPLHHRQARSRLRHRSRKRQRQLPRRLVHRLQTFRQGRHRASL
jgi:hypothetical protein